MWDGSRRLDIPDHGKVLLRQGRHLTSIQVKGDVVEERIYIEGSDSSLPVVGHWVYTVYSEDGTLVSRGLVARVNVQGAGHVLLDAGRFVMNDTGAVVWEAGTRQFVNGEPDELCEALS